MGPAEDKLHARFEALVSAAERRRLRFDELRELAQLYRLSSAKLSVQRTRGDDPEAVRYLNALCVRAYVHLYPPLPRPRARRGFLLRELPATLGRTARLQLLAAALIALSALVGARLVLDDETALPALVPTAMYGESALERLWRSESARREFLAPRDEPLSIDTLFAGSLFANNTRVGLLSLATGVLAGVPTTLLLLHNGLALGAFSSIFLRGPERLSFLAWIVPHAIPELLAIVLCGAGGLALGIAVVAPGRLGRSHALRRAALDALQLLAAAVPLLVVAALIESFVRQSLLGTAARFAVAATALLALGGYVALCRVLARRAPSVDVSFLTAELSRGPLPESADRSRAGAP